MIYYPLETLVFDFSWVSKLTILLYNFGATTRCILHPPNCVPIFPISPWYWKPSLCIFWGGRRLGDTTRCILAKCESGSCSRFLLWISVGKSNAEEKIKSIPLFYETEIPVLMTNGLFVFHLSRWVSSYRCVLQMEFTQLYWRCSVHCRGLGNASVYDNQRWIGRENEYL